MLNKKYTDKALIHLAKAILFFTATIFLFLDSIVAFDFSVLSSAIIFSISLCIFVCGLMKLWDFMGNIILAREK
jgi:hypothetical protein